MFKSLLQTGGVLFILGVLLKSASPEDVPAWWKVVVILTIFGSVALMVGAILAGIWAN